MTHNTLPPSKYGAGTTYEADGTTKHIVSPTDYEAQVDTTFTIPRIARKSGAIAVGGTVMEPIPLGPGFLEEVARRARLQQAYAHKTQLESVPEKSELRPGLYQSPNERQQALEIAEAQNIMRAASDAGMTVDQWKASRSKKNR